MKKSKEWFIYLEDYDQNEYCVVGPITADNWSDWFDVIEAQQNAGREIQFQEIQPSQLGEIPAHARSHGLTEADASELIQAPKDRSAEYKGSLPQYAQRADRSRLIKILCKGPCRSTRWAELNKIYPGKEALKQAGFGEYRATCLKCGRGASDNYNWYRP